MTSQFISSDLNKIFTPHLRGAFWITDATKAPDEIFSGEFFVGLDYLFDGALTRFLKFQMPGETMNKKSLFFSEHFASPIFLALIPYRKNDEAAIRVQIRETMNFIKNENTYQERRKIAFFFESTYGCQVPF